MPADFETTLTVTCDYCRTIRNVYKGRDLAKCAILAQKDGWIRLGNQGSVEAKYACAECCKTLDNTDLKKGKK